MSRLAARAHAYTWMIAAAAAFGVLLAGQGLAARKSTGKSAASKWQTLDGCRFQGREANDGDSFGLDCGSGMFVLRLYFVDAPETNLNYGERVRQQAVHFGTTLDETLKAGYRARELVQGVMRGPFTVLTKNASAPGRSREPRYYGLIVVGGRYLHEVLIAEGLARLKGVTTVLPDGTKSRDYLKSLRALEKQARIERKGAWSRSSR
jgi:endonuclease YncB( thermonuclease family)